MEMFSIELKDDEVDFLDNCEERLVQGETIDEFCTRLVRSWIAHKRGE